MEVDQTSFFQFSTIVLKSHELEEKRPDPMVFLDPTESVLPDLGC